MRYHEFNEDISRRGFLKGLGGAAALGAGGIAAQKIVQQQGKNWDDPYARELAKNSDRMPGGALASDDNRRGDGQRQSDTKVAQNAGKSVAKTQQTPGETGLQGHRQLQSLSPEDAKKHEEYLIAYAKKVLPANQVAPFIAQCAHETSNFRELTERGNIEYFKKKYDNRKSLKILGNSDFKDALNYLGRGYIHLTGRDNYTRIGNALDLDLENHPELAMLPENAAKIAVYYWKNRVANKVKDFSNTKKVSQAVNGPRALGLKDRMKKAKEYAMSIMPSKKKS